MQILVLEQSSLSAFRREPSGEVREVQVAGEVVNVSALTCHDVYARVALRDAGGRVVVKDSAWVGTLAPGAREAFQAVFPLPAALSGWPVKAEVELEFVVRGKTDRHEVPVE